MKYIMTLFWSVILTHVLGYVVSSVQGTENNYTLVTVIGVIIAILIFVIDAVLPKNEAIADHH